MLKNAPPLIISAASTLPHSFRASTSEPKSPSPLDPCCENRANFINSGICALIIPDIWGLCCHSLRPCLSSSGRIGSRQSSRKSAYLLSTISFIHRLIPFKSKPAALSQMCITKASPASTTSADILSFHPCLSISSRKSRCSWFFFSNSTIFFLYLIFETRSLLLLIGLDREPRESC